MPGAPSHRSNSARAGVATGALCLALGVFALAPRAGAAPSAAKAPPTEPVPIRTSADTVPATGTRSVDLTVARFGRYALSATSAQGSAVQLVDSMSGPGEVSGEPGRTNGRVDAFLERGAYRLRVHSDPAGTGEARVAARPFVEVNGPRPPLLPDPADVATTLADLEQRSWWIQVESDQWFAVELAGRSLGDVRLWRDGQWLDPAEPACAPLAADAARPLVRCELTARLGAGLYQLVAYGGPATPWSVNEADQPLYVRRGAPTLAEAGRLSGTVGPFGVERWRAPRAVTSLRLELPEAAPATLSSRDWDASAPFRRDGVVGSITKESLPPATEVRAGGSGERLVTVSGAPGQPFTLQYFPRAGRSVELKGSGPTYVTTLHMGDPLDRADATGVISELAPPSPVVMASLVPLGPAQPWRRKMNVLGRTSIGFDVKEDAEYHLAITSADVEWRWEPILDVRPPGYQPPAMRAGPGATRLAPGRWQLVLLPKVGGVAEVVVRTDPTARVEPSAPRAAVQLVGVPLVPGTRYRLMLGDEQGDVGLVTRSLPADLAEPLPFTLGAGETISIPVTTEPGELTAGGMLVSVDAGPEGTRAKVSAGSHIVRVRNAGTGVVQAALVVAAADRGPRAPLPQLPDTATVAPPPLPALTPGVAKGLDLARDASATFNLDVPRAGLYRVESTGLLATQGGLRTRTRPSLVAAAQNGDGRNFRVQTWLREGDYQVSVGVQGRSAGHIGLVVTPTTLRDGGELRSGTPARASLAAGEGVAWRMRVTEAGDHVIRAFGPGSAARVRLEDAEGWPMLAPEVTGDLRLHLDVGEYRLILLPEATAVTRIATFERVPDPVVRTGHGPFPLALDTPASHVWWEPAEGQARAPDTWVLPLAGPADVTVDVSGEMAGELVRGDEVHRLAPGRTWEGRLTAGEWTLRLMSGRMNSGVSYTVRVTTRELVAGVSRAVELPVALPVSVGSEGLYELTSMGLVDAAARLLDTAGQVIARSDDRPDDWNFRILRRLQPGAYSLRIDPVGGSGGRVSVTMSAVEEAAVATMQVGGSTTLEPGAGVRVVPLGGLAEGVLVARAQAGENVGIAVEIAEGNGWRDAGAAEGMDARVAVRLGANPGAVRLRVTSIDGRRLPVTVSTELLNPRALSEAALASGATFSAPSKGGFGALRVGRASAGALELTTRLGLLWCPAPMAACEPVPDTLLAAAQDLWLVGPGGGNARGARWALATAPGRVTLPGGPTIVDVGEGTAGPVLVFATSEAGMPGVGFGVAAALPTGGVDHAPRGAVAVGLDTGAGGGTAKHVTLLRADGGKGPMEVDLRRVAFAAPTLGALSGAAAPAGAAPVAGLGAASGSLDGGAAWRARLPGGPAELRLVLAQGLVAVLSRTGTPTDTIWAADAAKDVRVDTAADTLTVLNPTTGSLAWSVTAGPSKVGGPLSADKPAWEIPSGPAGASRFDVLGRPGDILVVRGGVAMAWGADGRVVRGTELPVGGPVRVEVAHGAGPWAAWVSAPTDTRRDDRLWGRAEPGRARPLDTAPLTVPAGGEVESVRAQVGPGLVQISMGQPAVFRARVGEETREVRLSPTGTDTFVSAASTSLSVDARALGGGPISGVARARRVDAAPLGEGRGAEVVLGAGEARAWTFSLTEAGPIGVGVSTGSPDVRVSLHGPAGLIGTGVVQMPSLPVGTYVLVAELAADAAPAKVRPALVGLARPDTGPPADVIRGYLVAAGLVPEAPGAPAEEGE